MLQIAIACLAIAAGASSLLLGWLWQMDSIKRVPVWLQKVNDRRGGSDLLL